MLSPCSLFLFEIFAGSFTQFPSSVVHSQTNKQNIPHLFYQQIIIIPRSLIKMININIKHKPNSSLTYQRYSPSPQISSKYRPSTSFNPQPDSFAQTLRLSSNWADRVTEHKFRSQKEDTLETASTPRAPFRQTDDVLDQGRWWAKNESDTSLQFIIKRQREKNEKLREQIQEQRNKHSRRMQLVNNQIKNINKQYDSYEAELSSLSEILDRLGI